MRSVIVLVVVVVAVLGLIVALIPVALGAPITRRPAAMAVGAHPRMATALVPPAASRLGRAG